MLSVAVPVACGDDESNPNTPAGGGEANGGEGAMAGTPGTDGGAGGAAPMMTLPGTSSTPMTLECELDDMCKSVATLSPTTFINPCCAESGACGVSTEFLSGLGATFEEVCQAKDQPGEADETCPTSADQMVPVGAMMFPVPGFQGCCRPSGVCGVLVNDIASGPVKFASFGLGCVDAAPFFPGEDPVDCGAGGGNAGGSGAGGGSAGGEAAGGGASGGAGGAG